MTNDEVKNLIPGLYKFSFAGGLVVTGVIGECYNGVRHYYCSSFGSSVASSVWDTVASVERIVTDKKPNLRHHRLYKLPNGDWIEPSVIVMIQAMPERKVLGYDAPSALRTQLVIAGDTQILYYNIPYEDAVRVRDELAAICNGG